MANALEVLKRIVREEYKNIKDGVNIHPSGFRDYTPEENSDFDEPHSTEKMESVNESCECENCQEGETCCSEMLNPPNYLDNQAPTPVNSPEDENLVSRGKRTKKSGQPKFGTFRNETITINGKKYKPRINQENVMKITKAQIREIIREELHSINEIKSGLTDDIKKFKTEYDVKHGKLKEKAMGLRERQQIMKAVRVVNEKIMEMLSELSKLPVTDALENVKKSHANKYIRAIETLKGICELNTGWLKENK